MAACTSPKTYNNLVNGEYTFEVRALDFSGNADPTPASYTWAVALGDFAASIDSTPDKITVDTHGDVRVLGQPGQRRDVPVPAASTPAPTSPVSGRPRRRARSPKTYTGLEPGDYEFWVRATDAASTFDTKMYAWTIGPPPVAAEVTAARS